MGHEVRNKKLHHHLPQYKHLHRLAARNYPPLVQQPASPAFAEPPLALPYYPGGAPVQPAFSTYRPNDVAVYDHHYNSQLAPAGYPGVLSAFSVDQEQQLNKALADIKRHGRNERIGEIGAAAAGAFAMYELHEAKVDPAHARRHNMEAKLAGAVALGSAGYAFHEHKEKQKSERLAEALMNGRSSAPKESYHHNQKPKEKQSHRIW